jgi:hypothetical protein
MRPTFLLAAIGALALVAGCSRDDGQRAGDDLKNAGHSVDHTAAGVANNPDVKSAEADLRHAGHIVAFDTRKAAAEAKIAAHKLAADTRDAAHDVTRHDRADDKSS